MLDKIRLLPAGWAAFAVAAISCSGVADETRRLVEVTAPASGAIREGGLSDLARDPRDSSGRTFLSLSDRGPNLPDGETVLFPWPSYHQKISRFHLDSDGAIRLVGLDSIRTASGRWTTGLPSPTFSNGEIAVSTDPQGRNIPIPSDSAGFDFEGLAAEGDSLLWASEEYGPRLLRLRRDAVGTATITREWSPGRGLPKVFARREANKGLEALCRLPNGGLVSIFQGALANALSDDAQETADRSLARRLIVLDPATGSVKELVAEMELPPKPKQRTKIGACTAFDDHRILVLEHRKAKKGHSEVDLAVWDLSKATDVGKPDDPAGHGRLEQGETLEEVAMQPGGLAEAGIRPISRDVILRDLTHGLPQENQLTKPEGLAIANGAEALIVFDNDFAVKGTQPSSFFLRTRLPKSLF